MYTRCDSCIADKSLCIGCRDNPKYADVPKTSYYTDYISVCPLGVSDCVLDPAYIKHVHPDWYAELFGDISVEEAVKQSDCCQSAARYGQCSAYDDEDK